MLCAQNDGVAHLITAGRIGKKRAKKRRMDGAQRVYILMAQKRHQRKRVGLSGTIKSVKKKIVSA